MEFPIESWFALPNRLTAEKKGTKQKKNNAPDLKSGAFCIYGLGVAMDDLLKKYTEYMRLENCRAEYKFVNGEAIEIIYKEENFAHLLGLHKLKDIQLIQFWLDKNNKKIKLKEVIRRIKNATFTDAQVRASVFYPKIQERYENFSYENLTTLTYTDAVVNFDPKKIKSKIKSDYLLFEKKNGFNHLGIALDQKTGNRYIETFFHQPDDMYIAGQNIVGVRGFALYDSENKIIVEDSF